MTNIYLTYYIRFIINNNINDLFRSDYISFLNQFNEKIKILNPNIQIYDSNNNLLNSDILKKSKLPNDNDYIMEVLIENTIINKIKFLNKIINLYDNKKIELLDKNRNNIKTINVTKTILEYNIDIDIYKKIAELYDNDRSFTLPTEHSYYIKLYHLNLSECLPKFTFYNNNGNTLNIEMLPILFDKNNNKIKKIEKYDIVNIMYLVPDNIFYVYNYIKNNELIYKIKSEKINDCDGNIKMEIINTRLGSVIHNINITNINDEQNLLFLYMKLLLLKYLYVSIFVLLVIIIFIIYILKIIIF